MPKADQRLTTTAPPAHLFGLPPLGKISVPDGLFLPGIDTSDGYALRLVGRALVPIYRADLPPPVAA